MAHFSRCAIGFRLAVRSVLPAENHIRDKYRPVTAVGAMQVGIFISVTSKGRGFTGANLILDRRLPGLVAVYAGGLFLLFPMFVAYSCLFSLSSEGWGVTFRQRGQQGETSPHRATYRAQTRNMVIVPTRLSSSEATSTEVPSS